MTADRETTGAPLRHPGGKLWEEGPEVLTETELIAILISSGVQGKPAVEIAKALIDRFQSLRGMADQPYEEFMKIKGVGKVKLSRIAAAFEIARRVVNKILAEQKKSREEGAG